MDLARRAVTWFRNSQLPPVARFKSTCRETKTTATVSAVSATAATTAADARAQPAAEVESTTYNRNTSSRSNSSSNSNSSSSSSSRSTDTRGSVPTPQPVLLFDGVCNLCNRSVDIVMKLDKNDRFLFGSLQQQEAVALLANYTPNLTDHVQQLKSILLVDGNYVYSHSTAAVRILWHLGGIWRPLAVVASLVPKPLRDWVYDQVAKNRYRIFGKTDSCRIPSAAERAKFL